MRASSNKTGLMWMIALLALIGGGKAILYDTLDPDCFWHLRVADQLVQDGIGPLVDRISFSSMQTPWTPYSWLAEFGMREIWNVAGFRGAILFQAMMIGGYFLLLGWAVIEFRKRDGSENNPLAIVLSLAFAIYLALPFLSFRPVTFVIDLLALVGVLLIRDRRLSQTSRAVWLIIPIALLATNCHFFAILIPVFVFALLAGSFIERDFRGVRRYALLMISSFAACLCTPMLGGAMQSIWNYQFNDPMVGGGVIAEFRPIFAGAWWSIAIFFLPVILIIARRARFRAGEIIWWIGTLLLVMRLSRFAPIYAIIFTPMFAASLPDFKAKLFAKPLLIRAIAMIVLIGIVRLAFAFPSLATSLDAWLNRNGPDVPGYPCEAAAFVEKNVAVNSGRIINEFSWGGYLGWRLQNRFQVFLDGRTQVFSPDFWRETYLKDASDAQPLLEASHADAAIVPISHSRFGPSLAKLGWREAFADDRARVLLPP